MPTRSLDHGCDLATAKAYAGSEIKLLLWIRGRFTTLHKWLERGSCRFPKRMSPDAARVEIDAHELTRLVEGLKEATGGSLVR